MKKGFSLVEFLIGLVLAFLVLELLVSSFSFIQSQNNDDLSQDLLSAYMLYEIFNVSVEIDVSEQTIDFKYLNEERHLVYLNKRLMIRPGTQIYFNHVSSYRFYVKDDNIFLEILRNKIRYAYLIGEI